MRIKNLQDIVKNKQAEKIDGVLVDTFTAHCILLCWKAGNENTKERIATGDIISVGKLAVAVCTRKASKL